MAPDKQKKIALLNQGAYGCIIRPSIKCSGEKGSNQYITKIQKKKDTSDREVQLGVIIRTLPAFSDYFAPVLNSCDVTMGTINGDEIKECEFINDTSEKYSTNKIKYVGKYTLTDYLLSVFQNKPQRFLFELLRTYRHILIGLNKLNQKGIFHFDLKDNNIMVRDKDQAPILIDFGLSITEELIQNQKPSAFFTYGPDYAPWCFDICLITYAINKATEQTASIKILLEVLNQFFIENPFVTELLSQSEHDDYKKLLMTYITKFENKPWTDIIDVLCINKNSWDNYAIAIIYLNLMNNMEITSFMNDFPIVTQFQGFLKSIVIDSPDKRMDSVSTKNMLEKTFTNISRNENMRMVKVLKTEAKNIENNERRRTKIATSKLSEFKKENLPIN